MVMFLLSVGRFGLVILFVPIMVMIGGAVPVSHVIAGIDIVQSRSKVIIFVMTVHHRYDHQNAIPISIA